MRGSFASGTARGVILIALLAALAALPIVGKEWLLAHDREFLEATSRYAADSGATALFALVLAAFLAAGMSGVLPLSLLAVIAGSLLGFAPGVLIAAIAGTTLSALLAFVLARGALRGAVERWIARRDFVDRFDQEMAARGWRFVLLIRLSPAAPFSVTSYAFGLTQVRLTDFLIGTLGSMPGLVAYLYSGALSRNLLVALNRPAGGSKWIDIALLGAGILATTVAAVAAGRMARRAWGGALRGDTPAGDRR